MLLLICCAVLYCLFVCLFVCLSVCLFVCLFGSLLFGFGLSSLLALPKLCFDFVPLLACSVFMLQLAGLAGPVWFDLVSCSLVCLLAGLSGCPSVCSESVVWLLVTCSLDFVRRRGIC